MKSVYIDVHSSRMMCMLLIPGKVWSSSRICIHLRNNAKINLYTDGLLIFICLSAVLWVNIYIYLRLFTLQMPFISPLQSQRENSVTILICFPKSDLPMVSKNVIQHYLELSRSLQSYGYTCLKGCLNFNLYTQKVLCGSRGDAGNEESHSFCRSHQAQSQTQILQSSSRLCL